MTECQTKPVSAFRVSPQAPLTSNSLKASFKSAPESMEPILNTDREEAAREGGREKRKKKKKDEKRTSFSPHSSRTCGDSQVTRCRNWQEVLVRTLTPSISDMSTQGSYRGSLVLRQGKSSLLSVIAIAREGHGSPTGGASKLADMHH